MSLPDLLPEYLLGTLAPADAHEVEQALAAVPALREDHDHLASILGQLALTLSPVAPSPALRGRLLAAVEAPEHRFDPFVDRLMALFDLTRTRVGQLLAALGDPASWERGPGRGIQLFHLGAGPRARAVDAGFVRMSPGCEFPAHIHHGREHALVLQGSYVEEGSTQVVRAGERCERAAGSAHGFRALDGPDLVFAVVLEGPIEIAGIAPPPDEPTRS